MDSLELWVAVAVAVVMTHFMAPLTGWLCSRCAQALSNAAMTLQPPQSQPHVAQPAAAAAASSQPHVAQPAAAAASSSQPHVAQPAAAAAASATIEVWIGQSGTCTTMHIKKDCYRANRSEQLPRNLLKMVRMEAWCNFCSKHMR